MAELRISIRNKGLKFTRVELAIIKRFTPVDTGKLRRGWKLINGDLVNRVKYAEYVQFGTKKMKARRFIEKAMRALLMSVAARLMSATPEGRKLLNAVNIAVTKSGSSRAIFRNTINPNFYTSHLKRIALTQSIQRAGEKAAKDAAKKAASDKAAIERAEYVAARKKAREASSKRTETILAKSNVKISYSKNPLNDINAAYLHYSEAKKHGIKTGDIVDGLRVGKFIRWRNDTNRSFSGFELRAISRGTG